MPGEETVLRLASEQEGPEKARTAYPEFRPDMAPRVIERLEAEIAALQKALLYLKRVRSGG
jgi:hypothetical protein